MMVSVCMATYNGEKYIKEQIDSILPQLGPKDELIVSDDGSKDRTLEIISSYQDSRILILNSNSKNIIKNFENALKNAKGEVIFLSDQDDIWHPSKVKECLEHLENHDLVFSEVAVFYNDRSDTTLFYKNKECKTGVLRNIFKNNYIGATMAFKRKVLDKALPFPKGIYMHDIWLAMLAEIIGRTKFIDKKVSMRIVLVYNLFKRFVWIRK